MRVLKAENSFRRRVVTLLGFACILAASTVLASRVDAQTATGVGSIAYTVTGAGWTLGTFTETDNGGNYNIAGISPFSVTSTVHIGDIITSRQGTITVEQHFILTSTATPPPDLQYDAVRTVQADIGSFFQRATASSTHKYIANDNIEVSSFPISAEASGEKMSDYDTKTDSPVLVGFTSFTDTGIVDSSVWEMEGIAGF